MKKILPGALAKIRQNLEARENVPREAGLGDSLPSPQPAYPASLQPAPAAPPSPASFGLRRQTRGVATSAPPLSQGHVICQFAETGGKKWLPATVRATR